jgi:hypothetical protein
MELLEVHLSRQIRAQFDDNFIKIDRLADLAVHPRVKASFNICPENSRGHGYYWNALWAFQ